jgi:hypothetical protein
MEHNCFGGLEDMIAPTLYPNPQYSEAQCINPLKLKLILISTQSVSQRKRGSITEITWLLLFKEIIAVYSEMHTKSTNAFCGQNAKVFILIAGGTYSYHWALKG